MLTIVTKKLQKSIALAVSTSLLCTLSMPVKAGRSIEESDSINKIAYIDSDISSQLSVIPLVVAVLASTAMGNSSIMLNLSSSSLALVVVSVVVTTPGFNSGTGPRVVLTNPENGEQIAFEYLNKADKPNLVQGDKVLLSKTSYGLLLKNESGKIIALAPSKEYMHLFSVESDT